MNPTGDATQVTEEFVFLRFQQPFLHTIGSLFRLPETWVLVPLLACLILSIAATLAAMSWAASHRAKVRAGRAQRRDPVGGRLKLAAGLLWFVTGCLVLTALFQNDTYSPPAASGPGAGTVGGRSDRVLWSLFTGGVFVLGSAFTIALYVRDMRTVKWYWGGALALCRITVYGLLCFAFLLPAVQTFDKSDKRSRVVILLDISPSVTVKSDDVGGPVGRKPKTRFETVIELLTDKDVALLQKLLEKNPVVVYRFGNRLDDEPEVIAPKEKPWGWRHADLGIDKIERPADREDAERAEAVKMWVAFAAYDFKPFLLKGLSKEGREAVVNSRAWDGEKPGTPNWADGYFKLPVEEITPGGLSDADRTTFQANRDALARRIEVAKSIVQGTNITDAVSATLNRESGNMVQGIIVISDGRSNLGGGTGFRELRAKAAREKVPLFTIAVGEDRDTASISITGIQAPETAPPDAPFKMIVEADGVNLGNQPANVSLDLFLPGKSPKTDAPDATLAQTLPFAPGDPPHLQADFVIDPDKLPEALTEVKDGKKVLKQGSWTARARIPRDPREATADAEHVFERSKILVLQKPLKVLLVSSTPSHEYQKLRDLLVREVQEKRAELCILLQTPLENVKADPADPLDTNQWHILRDNKNRLKEALKGIVQNVDENRLLVRFPDRLQVGPPPEGVQNWEANDADYRFYNLNEYDLVIALDADWSGLSRRTADNLKQWVVQQGGGLIFVAGPMKTDILSRVEVQPGGKNNNLLPILEILPVIPEDAVVLRERPTPRTERRLYLTPPAGSDLLKLDEAAANDPIAGWEQFFTDRDVYAPLEDPLKEVAPRRGFYSAYPIKNKNSPNKTLIEPERGGFNVKENGLKPTATLLAEFAYPDAMKGEVRRTPWYVVMDPVGGRGRSAFIASPETYRMAGFDKEYYDRFWFKLMKFTAGTRDVKKARGRVLLEKEYVIGAPVRIQAQLLDPQSRPYDATKAPPPFEIQEISPTGEVKPFNIPYPLVARRAGADFDGYYSGQVFADAKLFQTGEYRYRVVVKVPDSAGETIEAEFKVRPSDPEMDNTRTDFAALLDLAGDLDKDFEARIPNEDTRKALLDGLPKLDGMTKLAFRLKQRELVTLIPECMTTQEKSDKVLGKTDDVWDRGFAVPAALTSWAFTEPQTLSYLLLVVVGLLSVEWMARKLLRLA